MKYKGGRAVAERLGLRNSTLEEDNMIKKIFQGLAFFGFLSVAFFILFLFNNKENTTFGSLKRFSNPSDTLPPVLDASDGKTPTPPTTIPALERCPETPPDLVGPLLVEFDSKRTLDEVKEKFGSPLQEGGRYKPPDCTAQQKVAIIIAFRNRHEHLIHWLYYLHPILMRQQLDYTVYVINQDGEGVFNRAKLMNAGYVEAMKEYDYDCFVFSDIDLVPMDDRNLYRCFDNPRHLAVAMDKFNFHLPYNSYFGGVSALSKSQYLKINGFPNTFWGWGGEDDDIYGRIIFRKMSISRPDSVIGKYRMIKHSRDLHNEPNPENPGKLHHTKHTMEKDGLNSLNYTVKEIKKDVLYTFINVDIEAPIK